MKKKVLFVCTGNYYRSRFAEILFNFLASRNNLNWEADSRGIDAALGAKNIGPISPHVLNRLKKYTSYTASNFRPPIQLTEADLAEADFIIALDKNEHFPLISQKFTRFANQVTYWDIPDLNIKDPEDAMSTIEKNVFTLLEHLQTGGKPSKFCIIDKKT